MQNNGQTRGFAAAGHKIPRNSAYVLALAGIATAFLAAGCTTADAECEANQYPVKAVGSLTGSACQNDGQAPSAGYVRYPKGEVPQHVGDKWDRYWSTVVVSQRGQIVKLVSAHPAGR